MAEELDTYETLRERLDNLIAQLEPECQGLGQFLRVESWSLGVVVNEILERQLEINRTVAQLITLLDFRQQ